jgi:hypothetical protein
MVPRVKVARVTADHWTLKRAACTHDPTYGEAFGRRPTPALAARHLRLAARLRLVTGAHRRSYEDGGEGSFGKTASSRSRPSPPWLPSLRGRTFRWPLLPPSPKPATHKLLNGANM